jgi:hypothetical protein
LFSCPAKTDDLRLKSLKINYSGPHPSRRDVSIGLLLVPFWSGLLARPLNAASQTEETLHALVETLVPRDETPSAADLGIDKRLQAMATGIENYGLMIEEGTAWLDNQANGSFSSLPLQERERVLELAFSQPEHTLPQVFAVRIRSDTLTLYYQDPRAWRGLPISSPIQPDGYPDQAKRPI